MRQQTSREQMAGRGAGDGLAQYAGGKLHQPSPAPASHLLLYI
ncbi:hypothetical protein [Roseburia sp. AM51-8]|nr:hypothetical protein [Roseburia sp. AM51-8]